MKINKKIDLIIYDFDGVMTDNKVYIDQNGNEMVMVNRSDGLGVDEIKKLGIKQMIISTEKNPIVSLRAEKIGLPCLQGIDNKKLVLRDYCNKNHIKHENIAYIGNDINDMEAMKFSGLTFCPADSHKNIKEISDYILKSKGGHGVIRELLDLLKNKKG